ncbi:MAG: hypothetical protein J6I50_01075, partial [Clostridia bacterium]|nr:hypothetical protein [Clostridia bacterium]
FSNFFRLFEVFLKEKFLSGASHSRSAADFIIIPHSSYSVNTFFKFYSLNMQISIYVSSAAFISR